MYRVERIDNDGQVTLEPFMGDSVNVDNAIVDRVATLTDEQRRSTACYRVTDDLGTLEVTYGVSVDMHSGAWRVRLAWSVGDVPGVST